MVVQSRGQLWLILCLQFLVGMDVRLGLKVYLNVGAEVVVLCRFCIHWVGNLGDQFLGMRGTVQRDGVEIIGIGRDLLIPFVCLD